MDMWSYQDRKVFDKKGNRWHFMFHHVLDSEKKYDENPYELYFRDDDRRIFGVLRFERLKDNPYRNFQTIANKIMNNEEFRKSLIDLSTRKLWRKK